MAAMTGRWFGTRRKARDRSRARRFALEHLEARYVLTWPAIPPASIVPPARPVFVALSGNDAIGSAAITSTEIDYYAFTASITGSYIISTASPTSNLDTVLGVYNSGGLLVAYSNDISSSNPDSRTLANLIAGGHYYLGITNYAGSPPGSYTWSIDGAPTAFPDDKY